MSERFITSTLNRKDEEAEKTLRPQEFSSFPGQTKVKERLEVYVNAAKSRNEPLGHLLLSGPPGLGKTTLAYIIANEKGCAIKTSSGPVIEKPGDLAGLLTSLNEGDILFIDEIHRLNTAVEEYLYSAMEDFFIDIMIDVRVCHGFYDYYNSMSDWSKMGGIAIIRTDRLEPLADSFSKIVQKSKDTIPDINVDNIQCFDCFNHHVFYDFENLADYLCDDAELMKEFRSSLKDCVLFSKSTDCIFKGKKKYDYSDDPQYEIKIDSYCGLSVYIPLRKYDSMGLNDEYRKTEWSIVTGY